MSIFKKKYSSTDQNKNKFVARFDFFMYYRIDKEVAKYCRRYGIKKGVTTL